MLKKKIDIRSHYIKYLAPPLSVTLLDSVLSSKWTSLLGLHFWYNSTRCFRDTECMTLMAFSFTSLLYMFHILAYSLFIFPFLVGVLRPKNVVFGMLIITSIFPRVNFKTSTYRKNILNFSIGFVDF